MVIRIILESLAVILVIIGFCFEERIAKWERRTLQKFLDNKPVGKKLEKEGIYPYDIKKERLS